MATQTFAYTGAVQTFVVPTGVTSLVVECWGAQGGDGKNGRVGGSGGYVKGTLAVTPGETLNVYVGQKPTGPAAGWNGGGGTNDLGGHGSSGGGGGSDVRQGGTALSNRKIVAGGGGGTAGGSSVWYSGGNAGGLDGVQGQGYYSNSGGYGGTQTAGGAGATGGDWSGSAGSLGQGGAGGGAGSTAPQAWGGAGGGGYYGGGGGAGSNSSVCGAGGGGSSWTGGVSSATNTAGVRTGHGQVVLTYNVPPNAPTLGAPADLASVGNDTNIAFSWTHSDPDGDAQDAYSLRRSSDSGATYEYWNGSAWVSTQTWIATSTQNVSIPGGTFVDDVSYLWSVATRDPGGATGPYAADRTLTIQDAPPSPVHVSPSANSTVSSETDVTFQWDIGDPGDYQSAYLLRRKRRP